jgi:hypothetical protein
MALRSMVFIAACFTCLGLAAAGCSFGQDAAAVDTPGEQELFGATDAPAADAPDAATSGDDEVGDIFSGMDNEDPTPAEPPAAAEEQQPGEQQPGEVRENRGAAATAADAKVHELTERVAALETVIEELRTQIDLLRDSQRELTDQGDFSTRALGAMAEDADLRSTMGQMLQGKVRLVNDTGEPQVLYINGTAWTVVPGDSYVLAPVGTVAFQYTADDTPIFKGIQEWTENRSNGQFEVEFRLGASQTANEYSVLRKLPER